MQRQSSVTPSNISFRLNARLSGPGQESGGQQASWGRGMSFMGNDLRTSPPSDSGKETGEGEDEVVQSAWARVRAVLKAKRGGQVAMVLPGKGSTEESWQVQAQKERVALRTLLQGGISQSKKWRASSPQVLRAEGAAADGSSQLGVKTMQGDISVTRQVDKLRLTHMASSSGALPPSAAQAKLSSSSVGEGDRMFEDH
eukprot:1139877-Pelagomonas_calceolata.AAC.5